MEFLNDLFKSIYYPGYQLNADLGILCCCIFSAIDTQVTWYDFKLFTSAAITSIIKDTHTPISGQFSAPSELFVEPAPGYLLLTSNKNIKNCMSHHFFPFPAILTFASCSGLSNSFSCFVPLCVLGYLLSHHPLSSISLTHLSFFAFLPSSLFLPSFFNIK